MVDLQDLRERCDAAIADYATVGIRKDELSALLEQFVAAHDAIVYALRRVGTDADFAYHMQHTETLERLVRAHSKIANLNSDGILGRIREQVRALPQSRCAADRAFIADGGRI